MTTTTTPEIVNFTVYEGATFRTVITWKTGTPKTPVDLSSFTARLSLKSQTTGNIALTLTESAGLTLGGTDGTIEIEMTAAQTEALDAETYVYDLRVEAPSGEVSRVIQGTITVSARVTAPS